jgi:hypothetical protein
VNQGLPEGVRGLDRLRDSRECSVGAWRRKIVDGYDAKLRTTDAAASIGITPQHTTDAGASAFS